MQWAIFAEIIGIILTAVFILLKVGVIKRLADKIKGTIDGVNKRYELKLRAHENDISKLRNEYFGDKLEGAFDRINKIYESELSPYVNGIRTLSIINNGDELFDVLTKIWYSFLWSGLNIFIVSCIIWVYGIPIDKMRQLILTRRSKKYPDDIRGKGEIKDFIESMKNAHEEIKANINIGTSYILFGIRSLIFRILSSVMIFPEKTLVFITSRIITNWCIGIGTFIIIASLVFQLVLTP